MLRGGAGDSVFSDCLTLEGGVPFDLQPFQAFIVGSCFGWYLKGWRRFRTAYVETGKGRKTPLAAGIGFSGLSRTVSRTLRSTLRLRLRIRRLSRSATRSGWLRTLKNYVIA